MAGGCPDRSRESPGLLRVEFNDELFVDLDLNQLFAFGLRENSRAEILFIHLEPSLASPLLPALAAGVAYRLSMER